MKDSISLYSNKKIKGHKREWLFQHYCPPSHLLEGWEAFLPHSIKTLKPHSGVETPPLPKAGECWVTTAPNHRASGFILLPADSFNNEIILRDIIFSDMVPWWFISLSFYSSYANFKWLLGCVHRKSWFTRKNCGKFLENKDGNLRHWDVSNEQSEDKGVSHCFVLEQSCQHMPTRGLPDPQIRVCHWHPLCGRAWNLLLSSAPSTDSEKQTAHTCKGAETGMLNLCSQKYRCQMFTSGSSFSWVHSLSNLGNFGHHFTIPPSDPSISLYPWKLPPPWTIPNTPQNHLWCPLFQEVPLPSPWSLYTARMIIMGSNAIAYTSVSPATGRSVGAGVMAEVLPLPPVPQHGPWHIVGME